MSDGEGKSATVELNEPVSTAIIYGISLPTRFRVSGAGGTKYVVQLVCGPLLFACTVVVGHILRVGASLAAASSSHSHFYICLPAQGVAAVF